MNVIIYAGGVARGEELNVNRRYCEVIYCPHGGNLKSDGAEISVGEGAAVVVPAVTDREFKGSSEDICVLIERAVLPFDRAETVYSEDMAQSCAQAARWYSDRGAKGRDGVLNALGSLIAAHIYAAGQGRFSPAVEKVMREIDKNVGNPAFSLEEFMRTLPLNCDYVRKLFRRETGVTPHAYLMRGRIRHTRELMDSGITNLYSNYSVAQIAEAGGFSDPLYFSRVFKKYCGVSPSEYMSAKGCNR